METVGNSARKVRRVFAFDPLARNENQSITAAHNATCTTTFLDKISFSKSPTGQATVFNRDHLESF